MPQPVRSALVESVGARIRALRKARGLTQADVAEPQYTKAYISMLESGRTRASMKALEHIAQRLEVRPADLLAVAEPPRAASLELAEAERLLLVGDAEAAAKMLEGLTGLAPEEEARRLLASARAALARRDARGAVQNAERAESACATLADADGVARARTLLAQALLLLGDPDAAIAAARNALDGSARAKDRDPAAQFAVVATLARAQAAAGQEKAAAAQYERLHALAQELLELPALAGAYARVADRHAEAGNLVGALRLRRRSVELLELAELRATVARAFADAAVRHAERGERQPAREWLERARAAAGPSPDRASEAAMLVTEAELAAAAGDQTALELAQNALRAARRAADDRAVVRALAISGEVQARSDAAASRRAFNSARLHAEQNVPEALPDVYERWSRASERAGDRDEALRLARLALTSVRRR